VSSTAPPVGNTTAETVVSSGTQRNQAPDGDLIANIEIGNRAAQRKVIDIGVLSEDELLGKLCGYINSMRAFAQSTRNVHKELTETLANSNKIMAQYVQVLRRGRNNDTTAIEYKSARTQAQKYAQTGLFKEHIVSAASATEDTVPSSPDRACCELPACIEALRDIMTAQREVVRKLAEQVGRIHQQKQQLLQQQKTTLSRQQVQQEPHKSQNSQSNQEQEAQSPEKITKRQAQRQRMRQKQMINTNQQESPKENQLPALNQEGTGNANWRTVKKKGTGKAGQSCIRCNHHKDN